MLTCLKFNIMEEEKLSDLELVERVKRGREPDASLKELVSRHSGIYISMVNNYSPPPESRLASSREDLLSDKDYYIYQAALKYDESKKTKFSTYLGNETRWMCLNIYNKSKNSKEVPMDCYQPKPLSSLDPDPKLDEEVLGRIIRLINKDPDSRVSKIFQMRYIEGVKNKVMPWNQVCKTVNLSIQGCINVHDKAITSIKKELKEEI